jgi:glycine dehydrogenase subunit 2
MMQGGLLYYDGANLNAILGQARPADMGFDVLHFNLHKTFATPHGSGGPGSGPVAANDTLAPYLPIPMVAEQNGFYHWQTEQERPQSIGRLGTFMGNTGVLLRAYAYIKQLGKQGLQQVSRMATLNANYMFKRLQDAGFKAAFPHRRASHEFIISLQPQTERYGVTAAHFAKRLLDYGVHAPTVYFPLLIPECFLIEPTETESKQTIDDFVEIMLKINAEAKTDPELVKSAPHTLAVKKLNEVKAAKDLDLVWFSQPRTQTESS